MIPSLPTSFRRKSALQRTERPSRGARGCELGFEGFWKDLKIGWLSCHSEHSEESPAIGFRFFTPLRCVQNDTAECSPLDINGEGLHPPLTSLRSFAPPCAEAKGARGMLACLAPHRDDENTKRAQP